MHETALSEFTSILGSPAPRVEERNEGCCISKRTTVGLRRLRSASNEQTAASRLARLEVSSLAFKVLFISDIPRA
jgi:hypothetical protein